MAHKDLGYKLLDRVFEQVSDIAVIDSQPTMAGKHLSITVRVSNNAKNQDTQGHSEANQED